MLTYYCAECDKCTSHSLELLNKNGRFVYYKDICLTDLGDIAHTEDKIGTVEDWNKMNYQETLQEAS